MKDEELKQLLEEEKSDHLFALGLCYLAGIGVPQADQNALLFSLDWQQTITNGTIYFRLDV